jgi:hypothetical protein
MNATKRASLAGLLDAPPDAPPMPPRPAETQTPEIRTPEQQSSEVQSPSVQTPEVRSPGARKPRPRRAPARATPDAPAQAPGLPKYKRLERKELLIWPDQMTQLSIRARSLNRERRDRGLTAGERITANTLIRVAVALLLSRAGELAGATEEELRRSLGLPD